MQTVKRIFIFSILATAMTACATSTHIPRDEAGPLPQMSSAKLDKNAPVTRIALGSCFVPQFEENAIWQQILLSDPDLFLFLGDNVYQSEENGRPELLELKAAYRQLAAVQPFADLRQRMPVLPTWDDHDYGFNDAGADFAAKYESERLFEHVWDVPPRDPRRKRDGIYMSQIAGPPGARVQIIVLDTRFFRSPLKPTDERNAVGKEKFLPTDDPQATILGEQQWQWLERELEKKADVRLLVSSIQVLAEGHGREKWGNFPAEKKRLTDLITKTKAGGLVILSGDRHVAGHYRAGEGAPYPLFELTSSALNFPMSEGEMKDHVLNEPGPNRVGDLYGGANFGIVDIDWQGQSLALSIHDASGRIVSIQKVDLAELVIR